MRWVFRRIYRVCVGVCLAATACQTEPDRYPPGQAVWITKEETRLIFNAPALIQSGRKAQRFTDHSGQFVEETVEWRSNNTGKTIAGILLSESSKGPPITDVQDPQEVMQLWAVFRTLTPTFGALEQSKNTLGPVLWRRASIGTRACVLFLQRWTIIGTLAPSAPITNLSGYYCRPPGAVFPPEIAEDVIQSIGFRRHTPASPRPPIILQ